MGDEVMAIAVPAWPTGGAQAERVVVPVDSTALIPDGIDVMKAATLPMNGLTAYRALDLLDLNRGDVLLVTGAAGTLGGYLIQLAALEGLEVVA
ncbi:MAG: NADP-dependent oxidoreductase, partial [Actinomycetota bacterium]